MLFFRYLFWTDWSVSKPCIGRSLLDGSNAKCIIENPSETPGGKPLLKWPNGIAIDYSKDQLYWVDAFMDRMMTANLEGGNVRSFLESDVWLWLRGITGVSGFNMSVCLAESR